MNIKAFLTFALLILPGLALAQSDDEPDPIRECYRRNDSSEAALGCVSDAVRAAERELERVYRLALSEVEDAEWRRMLERSQAAWRTAYALDEQMVERASWRSGGEWNRIAQILSWKLDALTARRRSIAASF